jgi:hypothetical protein
MNAALSDMVHIPAAAAARRRVRFYLAAAFVAGSAAAAGAQAPAVPAANGSWEATRPPLGSSFTVDALGALPSSASLFTLLDTSVPDVITDLVDTGGITVGNPPRVGAHGSTWTQTIYRLGDADLTDPAGSGKPLLSPGVAEWDRVDVATGIIPIDASAPGMAVQLTPRRPFDAWSRALDFLVSPPGLNADGPSEPPFAIARLNSWVHGSVVAGGPATDRIGMFTSGAWTRSSSFERQNTIATGATLGSGFVSFSGAARTADQFRVIGWLQRAGFPLEHHAALAQPSASERDWGLHLQAGWERQLNSGAGLRAFANYTARRRAPTLEPPGALGATSFVTVERLLDGPIPTLLDPGNGTDRILNLGARYNRPTGGGQAIAAGAEFTRSTTSQQAAFAGGVGELLNGIPARAWVFSDPAAESQWRSTNLSAFVSDTAAVNGRLTLNGGLRFESIRGSAADAAADGGVTWNDFFPRAGLHFALTHFWEIATFAQYGRYGHRLPLNALAYGDPAAPTASVYRWTGTNLSAPGALGALIQRTGPGTGGNAAFSAVDPGLKRPHMDEMIFGFESRPNRKAFARMAAIARRESPLIGVVNTGVPESVYSIVPVFDTGIDRIGDQDDQTLLFYNRPTSSFGHDQYLLTNPDDHVATYVGVDFVGEAHAKRLFVIAGGTAGRSEGISASRGFGPLENDAALLGEAFIDPNARVYAQGRVYTERGYTIKTAIAYQFDRDLSFGLVGRYEDGQHFARLVVQEGLNQGPEAVRAFRNGRTRFTFSMTVDARLQKGFAVGGHKITAVFDAYNLFNQHHSIEEAQVTGAGERQETAVQPPRAIHLGVRIPF